MNEWGEGMHLEGDEKSNFNKIVAFRKEFSVKPSVDVIIPVYNNTDF